MFWRRLAGGFPSPPSVDLALPPHFFVARRRLFFDGRLCVFRCRYWGLKR